MDRLAIVVAIVAVVAIAALVARRRRTPDAPTQRRYATPSQLDRADFPRPDAPWLVAVFTSAGCDSCSGVVTKAAVLECEDVAVAEIEFGSDRALHERYGIDAVPTSIIADRRGVVAGAFLGPMTATDLWAAVAEAREPGSSPSGGDCRRHVDDAPPV